MNDEADPVGRFRRLRARGASWRARATVSAAVGTAASERAEVGWAHPKYYIRTTDISIQIVNHQETRKTFTPYSYAPTRRVGDRRPTPETRVAREPSSSARETTSSSIARVLAPRARVRERVERHVAATAAEPRRPRRR